MLLTTETDYLPVTKIMIAVIIIFVVMMAMIIVSHIFQKKQKKEFKSYGNTAAAPGMYAIKYTDKVVIYTPSGEILFEYPSGDVNIYSRDETICFVLPDGTEKLYDKENHKLAN